MTAHKRLQTIRPGVFCFTVTRLGIITILLLGPPSARSESNTTLIVTGPTTTNIGGALTIGSTGTNNSLLINNGGAVTNTAGTIGDNAGADFNYAVVSNANSIWYNSGNLIVGSTGSSNLLTVADQSSVSAAAVTIGSSSSSSGNQALVTGSNSLLQNSGNLTIGTASAGNVLVVSNGGHVASSGTTLFLGSQATANGNRIIITGKGSVLDHASSMRVGTSGSDNQIIVTNGGALSIAIATYFGFGGGAGNNNLIWVTGSDSTWTNLGDVIFNGSGTGNVVRVENGASMLADNLNLNTSSNKVVVSGSGSAISVNSTITLGFPGTDNLLVVTNGGSMVGSSMRVGRSAATSNNSVVVTGGGSILQLGSMQVGSNSATTFGLGSKVTVSDGGTLQADTITLGFLNSASVSNNAGIYQFSTATPTITDNSTNSMVLVNGTISFRDVAAANVYGNVSGTRLTNVLFQGNNGFRLNNSSNSTSGQDYTFSTTSGATNYSRLELVNGNTLWRSSQLTVGSGGSMLASNTVGTVSAVITNIGTITVVNSKMTWSSNVVINGRYVSDPSTNTFLADVTVDQSGALAGGSGDLFDFKKSLLIHSTNNTGYQLGHSAVTFSGGGVHTNAITGRDFNTNDIGFAANFAYGELHLGTNTDILCLECGNIPGITSNGLYVGWLDLLNSTNLVANLHTTNGINIYYDKTDVRNSYLAGITYQLTDCDFVTAGGFLMPVIPEPSVLAFVFATAMLLGRRWLR